MKHYPEQVQLVVQKALDTEGLQNFVRDEEVDEGILTDLLCESLFPKYMAGDELVWTEDEVEHIMKMAMVNTVIESLKSNGYLDSIEDENGEEIMWITQKAKDELAEQEEQKKPKKKKKKKS